MTAAVAGEPARGDCGEVTVVQDESGDRGAALGTSGHLGGVVYDKLGVPGRRVAGPADAAARPLGPPVAGARVALQGFGAVGSAAARRFTECGATVVAHPPPRTAPCPNAGGLGMEGSQAARGEHGDHCVTRAVRC